MKSEALNAMNRTMNEIKNADRHFQQTEARQSEQLQKMARDMADAQEALRITILRREQYAAAIIDMQGIIDREMDRLKQIAIYGSEVVTK